MSVAALALLPGTELLVAAGRPRSGWTTTRRCSRLRALARDAGVADRVRFLGGVDAERVPALLRSADVVLCPADYEPFGIVPLEAMACGRPVVASAVGGQLDTVAAPATGSWCRPATPRRWPRPWRACSPTRRDARPAGWLPPPGARPLRVGSGRRRHGGGVLRGPRQRAKP
ncbi:glycosyltransferase [Streptomyces sp. MMS20-AI2-20]|uniref:glycosyltransferase n=1 Tax=Streptomyces sp. MMS20-AI2-20 TaxID=2925835 RepID=UPI0027E55EB5|nr:glycosyltransferase [Streptomyces sp. MMS20-AI2-20]